MTMLLRILAVIPVHNRETFVLRALDSVAAQSLLPDAIVVIDDGSSDGSASEVSAWSKKHAKLSVTLLSTPNQGAAAARNLGVTTMGKEMDLVAFLDSDDQWPTDFLARGYAAMSTQIHAVAASTDRMFVDLDDSKTSKDSLIDITVDPWLWIVTHGAGIGSCTMFRLTAFLAAGTYPTDIPTGHDTVLFGRIALQGSWLHLPGRPTQFSRSGRQIDTAHGGHLHSRYENHLAWWAKATHQMFLEAPQTIQMNKFVRKAIGRRWFLAARDALQRKQFEEAKSCISHALDFRTWYVKYRVWQLLIFLMGKT